VIRMLALKLARTWQYHFYPYLIQAQNSAYSASRKH
jgi:hypothetical protein